MFTGLEAKLHSLAASQMGFRRQKGFCAMAKTYREVATADMLGTVEDAMREVLNCWAELPPSMQDAIDEFRTRLGEAIDSVEFVRKALNMEVQETGSRHRLG